VAQHDFGVDQVFGTAEGDQTDFSGHKEERGARGALAGGGQTKGLGAGFFVRAKI